jgi:two-component system response regulator FixJ
MVHVIDDDAAMRGSLSFLLENADLPNQCYASGPEFLAVASSLTCCCVITDIRMPEMNGLQLITALRALGSSLPVIVITGHGDVPLAVEAMKMGIIDFFEKPFHDDALITAVRWALSLHAEPAAPASPPPLLSGLSPREIQVLRGVIDGKANKLIGHELGISPRTVEAYRANVMTKSGAHGLPDLVRMAIRDGLDDGLSILPEPLPRAS